MSRPVDGLDESLVDGVRTIRIDRPDQANALTAAMMERIAEWLRQPARATILAGGAVFCAGVDTGAIERDAQATGRLFFAMLEAAAASPAPLVAAIEGPAVGAGWLLAACADRLVAGTSASFSLPEISMGIPPFVAHPLLHAALGEALWARAALGGETLSASELDRGGALELSTTPLAAAERAAAQLAMLDSAAFARLKAFARRALVAGIREACAASFAHIGAPGAETWSQAS